MQRLLPKSSILDILSWGSESSKNALFKPNQDKNN